MTATFTLVIETSTPRASLATIGPSTCFPVSEITRSDPKHGLRLTRPSRSHHSPGVQADAKSLKSAKLFPMTRIPPQPRATPLPLL